MQASEAARFEHFATAVIIASEQTNGCGQLANPLGQERLLAFPFAIAWPLGLPIDVRAESALGEVIVERAFAALAPGAVLAAHIGEPSQLAIEQVIGGHAGDFIGIGADFAE